MQLNSVYSPAEAPRNAICRHRKYPPTIDAGLSAKTDRNARKHWGHTFESVCHLPPQPRSYQRRTRSTKAPSHPNLCQPTHRQHPETVLSCHEINFHIFQTGAPSPFEVLNSTLSYSPICQTCRLYFQRNHSHRHRHRYRHVHPSGNRKLKGCSAC